MSRSRAVVAWLAASALLCLVTACTDDPASPGSGPGAPTASSASKAAGAPAPATRCQQSGNTTAEKVVVPTADKVDLAGVTFGSGKKGVLLLPQAGADLCRW